MKPLRVPVSYLVEGEMSLDEDASNYILRVHRATVGAPLVLFDPHQAEEVDAVLSATRGKTAVCKVGQKRSSTALAKHSLVLLQAFAKGDKVDRVVQEATALGATQIIVVTTERSVVQLRDEKGPRRRERWEKIAIEAARQCGRGDLPTVLGPWSMEAAIEHLDKFESKRLVLSLDGAQTLGSWFSAGAPGPVTIFIGPEGGFAEAELRRLGEARFTPVRFSQFVLRTETAATAVLGAIAAWHSGFTSPGNSGTSASNS